MDGSYSAVKLFSKYSNVCELYIGSYMNITDRQTDKQMAYSGITALLTSRGKNWDILG